MNYAIDFLKQLEVDRKSKHEELDAHFDALRNQIAATYGFSVDSASKPERKSSPATTSTGRRGRPKGSKNKPKVSVPQAFEPEAVSVTDVTHPEAVLTGSVSSLPAPPDSETNLPEVEKDVDFHDKVIAVHQFLLECAEKGAGRSEIVFGAKVLPEHFPQVIKHMLENEQVRKEGEKRGTRYFVRTAFDS